MQTGIRHNRLEKNELNQVKQRILIIGNDLVYRRSLFKVLSKSGYNVFVAESFVEAIELSAQLLFHLIIIDVRHPTDCGPACMEQLRTINPSSKIIIISTFDTKEFSREVAHDDFDAYLVKPVKRHELIETVEHII